MDLRDLVTRPTPSLGTSALRLALRGLSFPYRAVMGLRNKAYDWRLKKSYRSNLPIISVGNLSVGGTGKSPVVSWLASWLRKRDVRVAILSRGYGQLADGQNDEALELELHHPDVPHLQHWDRVASARLAEEELDMEVLLLDDGFQHRRIERDLDIVLLDATDTDSARWLLPGGLLREPMSSLRRAQAVLLTRVDQCPADRVAQLRRQVQAQAPQAHILEASHRPSELRIFPAASQSIQTLRGARVLAFCGIGNPNSFFQSLESLGAELVDRRVFPDHHAYDREDILSIETWAQARAEADMIVCTMKDWVKIQTPDIGGKTLAALQIELLLLAGKEQLEQMLYDLLEHSRPNGRTLAAQDAG